MNLKNVKAIFQREFRAYFDSPVAYVFLVAFLVLVGFLTFGVTMFYERRQANLTPFFFWHPWVSLLLVPAATMLHRGAHRHHRVVAHPPTTLAEALVGKFLPRGLIGIALALTFRIVLTTVWLGHPTWARSS